jgi:RNA polymerase sigma-70 factor, ECF subfamily
VTTVTTRLAIDEFRSARARRESHLGPWLPEPLLDDGTYDVAAAAETADSLTMAFLVILETLTPPERAAFLLHDVFGYGYGQIGTILGRTEQIRPVVQSGAVIMDRIFDVNVDS